MKLFLFLDDWFLDSMTDIVRHYSQASSIQIPEGHFFPRVSIIYCEANKCYLAIGKEKAQNKFPSLYKSIDGINWKKVNKNLKFKFADDPNRKIESIPVVFPFEQGLFYDKWDINSSRRYKMIIWPYQKGIEGGNGLIACSPDGINWEINKKYIWFKNFNGSDTNNNIFYNPFTKRWCVICRKRNTDRRIAVTESNDLENWSEPRIILHPDALDPSLLQFYGMVATLYEEEYFIGILQCFHVPNIEIREWPKGRIKKQGKVDAQLSYSYDGQYWLRSDRSKIIPESEPGSYGSSGIYPFSIVNSPDKKNIYIYSIGALLDHSKCGKPSGESLLLHSLRYDGFAYLEPIGGWGQFSTRTLIPNSGDITINYKAPVGTILVQIADSEYKPFKGFSFEDCIPIQGDKIYGKVRWKKHNNLSKLIGKPIRLMFKLFDARIYAIRVDCKLWYTNTEPIECI